MARMVDAATQSASAPAPVRPKQLATLPPFAPVLTAPRVARGHVQAALAAWRLDGFTDVSELIASELVANAVAASAGAPGATEALVIRICLITDGNVLTIECWDQAPGVPVLREADGFAETGRGLVIVDTLTGGAWGCRRAVGRPGKCVWAEIRLSDLAVGTWP